MSLILLQMILCLLAAAIIGGIIGWYIRGGCENKIKLLNEKCDERIRAVEREWNTKINYPEHNLNGDNLSLDASSHADLKIENQNSDDFLGAVSSALGSTKTSDSRTYLSSRGINLSDEKIQLYNEFGVDLENSDNLEDVYDIDQLVGLKSKQIKKLRDIGLLTTRDFTNRLYSKNKEIQEVADKLKVSKKDIQDWLSMSNLLTLPGLDPKEAKLLITANISSIKDLGKTNIYSLYKELIELNEKLNLVNEVPNIKSLELWSKIAKILK